MMGGYAAIIERIGISDRLVKVAYIDIHPSIITCILLLSRYPSVSLFILLSRLTHPAP